jgi:hypothetical protein
VIVNVIAISAAVAVIVYLLRRDRHHEDNEENTVTKPTRDALGRFDRDEK